MSILVRLVDRSLAPPERYAPDSARENLVAVVLSIVALLVIAFLASLVPGMPS